MNEFLAFIEPIARQAGKILLDGFGQSHHVEYKGDIDLVTEYDHLSEEFIISAIQKVFPDHSILSEESGKNTRESKYLWIVDPLDGTTNFAHGFPAFAVSIALTIDNLPIVGVVYDPLRDELYSAEIEKGANLNGKSIYVSKETQLDHSLIATGFPYDIKTNPHHNNLAQFIQVIKRIRGIRHIGSAALYCVWVAAGRLDGYWEFETRPWDTAAGALIAREAGGTVTTIENDTNFLGKDSIVVSNTHIHNQMLSILHTRY